MKKSVWVCVGTMLIVGSPHKTIAILDHPDRTQVEQALQKGNAFAQHHRPPNELYWHFGSTKRFEPHGFLVTKMSGLAVMAGHYALRGEQASEQDIQRVLAEDALQVIVSTFGNSASFAQDSYMLIKQDKRVVKPARIRFDARARVVGYDQGTPVYRAKIVGIFPYGTLKPESYTTLLIFPGVGGEIRFELDLATIP